MSSGSFNSLNGTAKGCNEVDDVDTGSETSVTGNSPKRLKMIYEDIDMFLNLIASLEEAKRCPNIIESLQGRVGSIAYRTGGFLVNLREALRLVWTEELATQRPDKGAITVDCYLGNLFFPRAVIDLNSEFTTLTYEAYNNLDRKGVLYPSNVMVKLADGTYARKVGEVPDFILFVGRASGRVTLHILDIQHVTHSLVLGRDFLDYSQAIIDLGKGRLIFPGKDDVELGYFKGCDAPFEDKDYLVFPMGNEFVMRVEVEKPYYLQPYEIEEGYDKEYDSNEEKDYGDELPSDDSSDASYEDRFDEEGWFIGRVRKEKKNEGESDDDVVEVINISDDEKEIIEISSDDESDEDGK